MNTFLLIVMFVFFTITYFLITRILALVARERIDVPRDYDSKPMVTVMMSCFNEGKAVYDTIQSIRSSNYPADKLEIIVRDDCSKDDSYEWMLKASRDFPGVNIDRNKTNQGKPYTMCDMAEVAKGEILISTDSDCVLDPQAIMEMVSCFKDPKIGSVGGRIGIRNVNDTLLTQAQTITYGCTFFLFKASENVFKRVQCLGGALVAFRKNLFLDCVTHIRTRNFLGNPIMNGEDRAVTQMLLFRGFRTFVNFNAVCWVNTPTQYSQYLNQQLRWRRSAMGQWMISTFSLAKRIDNGGMITTIGSLLPAAAIFVGLMLCIYLILIGMFVQALMSFLVIGTLISVIINTIFNWTVGKEYGGRQRINNPILTAMVLACWGVVSTFLITPWAMCTIDDGGWITRQITEEIK